jgi:hypothetical protein
MVILLLLLLSGLTPFLAAADEFCDNLKVLAATLPENTSSSPVHFAAASFGQAPNVAYTLALCRGDILNDTACGECVASLFQIFLNVAPCYKAVSYYGDCIFVYSANDILAPSNNTGGNGDGTRPFERWNERNVTGDVPLVRGLIRKLLVQTVEKAASTTPRRFATGAMDTGTTFPTVHSLAQCTPDLSSGDCLACLRRLLGMVNSTMSHRIGGQMGVTRCYFRYETTQFYKGEPMLRLGAPEPPPSAPTLTKQKSRLWVIPTVVVPVAGAAFLFCFAFYACRLAKRRKGMVFSYRRNTPIFFFAIEVISL